MNLKKLNGVKMYFHNLLVAIDQLFNVLLAGYPDETLSSRSWRCRNKKKFWKCMVCIINFIMFDKHHCENASKREVDLPKEYKNSWDSKY